MTNMLCKRHLYLHFGCTNFEYVKQSQKAKSSDNKKSPCWLSQLYSWVQISNKLFEGTGKTYEIIGAKQNNQSINQSSVSIGIKEEAAPKIQKCQCKAWRDQHHKKTTNGLEAQKDIQGRCMVIDVEQTKSSNLRFCFIFLKCEKHALSNCVPNNSCYCAVAALPI